MRQISRVEDDGAGLKRDTLAFVDNFGHGVCDGHEDNAADVVDVKTRLALSRICL